MNVLRTAAIITCIALLPNVASAKTGEELYKKKCKMCHSLDAGKNGIGPSLAGIMGQTAGTQGGYTKYVGLKNSDVVWDDANMDAWLANPKKFIGKKTSMMSKVKKAEERAAIIEYMHTK